MTMRIRTDKIGGFLTMAAAVYGGHELMAVFLPCIPGLFPVFLSKRCLKVDKTTISLSAAVRPDGRQQLRKRIELAVIRRFAPFCFYLVGGQPHVNDRLRGGCAPPG